MIRVRQLLVLAALAFVVVACLAVPTAFPCAKDGTCPSGFDCVQGQCTAFLACGSVQSDPDNCGECGRVCPGQVPCIAGACQCPEGTTTCGTACVDTQADAKHCGRCGKACAGGQVCEQGTCACSPDNVCAGKCRDLASDAQNCGACGSRCPTGAYCQEGFCRRCNEGELLCNGACVPSDAKNCGQCGRACDRGLTCEDGACVCPGNADGRLVVCTGRCVDPKRDAQHCGDCGRRCGAGETCTGGGCAALLQEEPQLLSDLALDATYVYAVTPDRVLYLSLAPGGQGYELPLGGVTRLAVFGSDLFFVQNAVLRRIPAAGGTASLLASAGSVSVLDVDASNLAYIAGSQVLRVPRLGGPVVQIGTGAQPAYVKLAGANIWWTERSTARLYRATLATNSSQLVANGAAGPFAVSATHVYAAAQGGGISRAPLPALSPFNGVASASVAPSIAKMLIDATHVYWSAPGRYGLWRAPLTGGGVTTLFEDPGASPVADFVLDDQNVYFRTETRVFRLRK